MWFLVVIFFTVAGDPYMIDGFYPHTVPGNTQENCVEGGYNLTNYLNVIGARLQTEETFTVTCMHGTPEEVRDRIQSILSAKPA